MLTLTYLHGNVIQELDLVPSRADSRSGAVETRCARSRDGSGNAEKSFYNSASLLSVWTNGSDASIWYKMGKHKDVPT
jgi:hypothetical protein